MLRLGIMVLILLSVTACSSLQPVESSPEELQQQISSGEVVAVGDRVKVVTTTGEHLEFRVSEINETSLIGNDVDIPINEIVALESRQFSGGKTALLAGGTIVFYQILAAIAAIAVLGG